MTNEPVVPRPASTLILLRETAAQPVQTLMVVRHQDIKFAGGAIVFPGGRVDATDQALAETVDDDAFKIAAIRETFEESGILLAYHAASGAAVSQAIAVRALAEHRAAVCRGELSFADMLREKGLVAATDRLVPFAHWITPPNRVKRFDTHFFVARYGEDQLVDHDGGEITEAIWISPADLIRAALDGQYKLVFATRMNVERLAAYTTVEQALQKIRATPVVTVRPETIDTPDGKRVRIPAAAGYGGELFVSNDPLAI
ncbi:MAG: NUDIX domain-containing protein [Rhodospirillales bacterium]|nr:NUDIX domain-containing protein [Rhodospirillales bacterium]